MENTSLIMGALVGLGWNNGTMEHWNTGMLEHWNTGTLERLEHWNAGRKSGWNRGTLDTLAGFGCKAGAAGGVLTLGRVSGTSVGVGGLLSFVGVVGTLASAGVAAGILISAWAAGTSPGGNLAGPSLCLWTVISA